jgi:hypothetical protein
MKFTIFYSWQSDLPNNTNRGFLESAIEKAIKDIGKDENFEIEPSLDRDTKGAPGSPNISQTILKKIQACDLFIADISIVTGDKKKGQRLSPNPNVLIELGYAISILGWDKIILICNEIYGKDEDLPFDIRQHRRIPYCLQPDDSKAPEREKLASYLKDRIIEIVQDLKNPVGGSKEPDLFVEWNLLNFTMPGKPLQELQTLEVQIPMLSEYPDIREVVKNELAKIEGIDGSIDPSWKSKASKFKKEAEEFLNKIRTEKGARSYFIDTYSRLSTNLTLSVTNNGTLPASDIRVEIPLPNWLLAFEKWPDKYDLPKKPEMPTPTPPKKGLAVGMGNFRDIHSIYDDSLLSNFDIPLVNRHRSSACYIKNENTIYLWADKLLHKHTLSDTDDSFYLLAKPEAVPGEYEIECRYFCVEYQDWKKSNLKIIVQSGA